MTLLLAAAAYFAIAFAAGFALGTVRVFLLEPNFGAVPATLIELPAMLLISWLAAGYVVKVFKVEARLAARLGMGLLAFAFLIGAEIVLGMVGFGRTLAGQIAEMTTPQGLLGITGQTAFALFPAIQLWKRGA